MGGVFNPLRFFTVLAFLSSLFATPTSLAVVPPAVPSVGGSVGYYTICTGKAMLYASTPELAIYGCITSVWPLQTTYAGWTFSLTSCNMLQDGYCKYAYVRNTGVSGTAQESLSIAVLPAKANCQSGIFDGLYGTCLGGPATCPAMEEEFLTVFDCPGSAIEGGLCTGNTGLVPGTIPQLLSSASCQYVLADPLEGGTCWQSSANKAMYCNFKYVSDGTLAPTGQTRALTDAATSIDNACPVGGCADSGGGGTSGNGSDGTTGGTGTVPCGGSDQPSCANGVPSGTTACGATGQPTCSSSGGGNGGGGGSAPVCGGPGLPACSVTDVRAAPVCGGPGLPACRTDAAPVCGGPGLPACASSDVVANGLLSAIANSLSGEGGGGVDPIPATVDELKAAGLDGGSTFEGLTSWELPAHTSTCPSGSFSAFGNVFVVDAHCKLALDNFGPFRDVMVVVFTLGALFIVLRA